MLKKLLLFGTLIMVLGGLLVTCVPFWGSLEPNEATLDKQPHVDVSELESGEIKEYRGPFLHVFISKSLDNKGYSVVAIPYYDGFFRFPEFTWERPVLHCANFGIDKEGLYACLDETDYWWKYMKWNRDGVFVGEKELDYDIPDLIKPRYQYKAGSIILLES